MNFVLAYLNENWQRLSLERLGAPSGVSCVITTPRFRSSSHILFFVLAGESTDPALVVKVPRLPGDHNRLTREAQNLQWVHASRPGGFGSIPRLVAYEEYLDNRLLVETALRGPTLSSRLKGDPPEKMVTSVVTWLIELHQATTQRSENMSGWYARLAERPLYQFMEAMPLLKEELGMIEQTQTLMGSLRDRSIPLVFEHRDLGPPNILLDRRDELGVVDWELAEPGGLPAVDLFFFLTLVTFVRRRARSRADYIAGFHETFFSPSAWARPHIVRYAESMHLSPEVLVPLFVLCWSCYVAGLVTRLSDFADSGTLLARGTAEWLRSNRYYALWRHALDHVDELKWM